MPFQQRYVRDLAWCLQSPPLYCRAPFIDQHWQHAFAKPLWPILAQLDHYPQLTSFNNRLGNYFEQLWCRLIELHPDYQLLAHDWLVADKVRTHGALDILVRHSPSQKIEHWELAVKFYLGEEDGVDPTNWIGPGRNDRLAIKLEQLLSKQLPLSRSQLAIQQLMNSGWRVDTQRIILLGRLFTPEPTFARPPQLSDKAVIGRWYRQSQLPQQHWRLLSRKDWLGANPWPTLVRWQQDLTLAVPQQLYCPETQQHAFVVPDNWGK